MCTSIVEIAQADGMAKAGGDWFKLTHAAVAYDHARHALIEDAITIDFVNGGLPPGARAAVELTLDAAKALNAALTRAIAAAEAEEALRSQPSDRLRPAADAPAVAASGNSSRMRLPHPGTGLLHPAAHGVSKFQVGHP